MKISTLSLLFVGLCLLVLNSVPKASARKQTALMLAYILGQNGFTIPGVNDGKEDGGKEAEEGHGGETHEELEHGGLDCSLTGKKQLGWKWGNWATKGYGWQWGMHTICNPYDELLAKMISKTFKIEIEQAKEAKLQAAKELKEKKLKAAAELKEKKLKAAKELKAKKVEVAKELAIAKVEAVAEIKSAKLGLDGHGEEETHKEVKPHGLFDWSGIFGHGLGLGHSSSEHPGAESSESSLYKQITDLAGGHGFSGLAKQLMGHRR